MKRSVFSLLAPSFGFARRTATVRSEARSTNTSGRDAASATTAQSRGAYPRLGLAAIQRRRSGIHSVGFPRRERLETPISLVSSASMRSAEDSHRAAPARAWPGSRAYRHGPFSGEDLLEHQPERVEIAGGRGRFAPCLLGLITQPFRSASRTRSRRPSGDQRGRSDNSGVRVNSARRRGRLSARSVAPRTAAASEGCLHRCGGHLRPSDRARPSRGLSPCRAADHHVTGFRSRCTTPARGSHQHLCDLLPCSCARSAQTAVKRDAQALPSISSSTSQSVSPLST